MAERRAAVLIVGAGVIGAMIAYQLARRGCRDVVVVDRGRLGDGSSVRAAGGLRYEFANELLIRCSQLSIPFFATAEAEFGTPVDYREVGYAILARTQERLDAFRETSELQRRLGVQVELLTPAELAARFPYLNLDGIIAGTWCPQDVVIDQAAFMAGLGARLRQLGVEVREGVEVTALRLDGERVTGVETAAGPIEAATTVLATGAWAPALGRTAGLELPIRANRREIFTTGPATGLPRDIPFVRDLDRERYVRGDASGFRLSGGTGGDTPIEAPLDLSRGPAVRATVAELVPALRDAPLIGGWAGLIENTPDNHPLVGQLPERPGLLVAAGFCGFGLMHAPVIGVLAAELLLDGATSTLDISALAPDRFARGAALDAGRAAAFHERTHTHTPPDGTKRP